MVLEKGSHEIGSGSLGSVVCCVVPRSLCTGIRSHGLIGCVGHERNGGVACRAQGRSST